MTNLFTKRLTHFAAIVFAFLLSAVTLGAQNHSISGKVLDEQGVPVIGAAVVVVGQNSIGVMTDADGLFALNVPAGSRIQVSCIGYVSQTVAVGNQSTFNFVLVEDSQLLEETVVIGYGVQKKSDLTGSVASVRAADLTNRSTTDAAAALQGKVSGVHIITSGAPGAGADIRVRGYSSNSGNISPLYIVDGLQVSSIQYLDPSMIESIEVLKDAASAAIYGAEAGNGVVLVTTKSGNDGKATVSYSSKATLQTFNRRPVMSRTDFVDYISLKNGEEWTNNKIKDYDYSHPLYKDGVIDQDWISAYTEPTWSQQHSLSFSGGNNKGHFFASLNYVKDDGIVRGDKDVYTRLSSQVNADYQLFKWLNVGSNMSLEKWSTKSVSHRGYGSSFEQMLVIDPLTPVYWTTVDEMSLEVRTMYEKVQAGTAPRNYRFLGDENGWYANTKYSDLEGSPFAKRDGTDSSSGGINIKGTLFANFTPFKGLTVTSRFGYRISQSSSHSYTAPYYIGSRGSVENYSISASANTGYYYQWENFANYTKSFGKHSITAMAGMSYRENNSDNVSGSASGEDILTSYEENFLYLNYLKSDASKSVSNAPSKSASLAYFGRLVYSYDNRYSIQANFRADAFDSSKLPANTRWGYFPSVSAGWTVSNESFIKDNIDRNILSFLKIRASWGQNGNIGVLSNYPYATTISLGNNWYQYSVDNTGTTYGSSPSGLPNPNLKWETSEQLDLGLDARLFNDRLTFGFDFYNKKTKDLLVSVTTPPELGVSSTTINGGGVLNRGFEFDLGWKDSIGDFNYSINANLSTLHNEVTYLPAGVPRIESSDASSTNYQIRTAFEPGYPVWYLLGYIYDGIDENGKYKLRDMDGDKDITSNDMTYIGKTTPDLTYGLTINLEWKGIDFTLYGSGIAGNSIMPVLHRTGFKNTLKYYYENSRTDSNPDGYLPHPSQTEGKYDFWSSSANVFKGDYFRIKQMQLGYTLPKNLTRKAAINDLRFYVSLDDFFTFTKYPGLDPETASTNSTSGAGLDWGSYPTMQKVILGVNITF